MPFRPVPGDQTVAEAALGLRLAEALSREDWDRLKGTHQRWRVLLPRLEEPDRAPLAPAEEPAPVPESHAARILRFSRRTPSGTPQWHLLLQSDGITVHCLRYTRWKSVWPIARWLFSEVANALPGNRQVRSMSLESRDVFAWEGEAAKAGGSAILPGNATPVAEELHGEGGLQSLDTGALATGRTMPVRVRLERVRIGSVESGNRTTVRFEVHYGLEFNADRDPVQLSDLGSNDSRLGACFARLRQLARAQVRAGLSPGMFVDTGRDAGGTLPTEAARSPDRLSPERRTPRTSMPCAAASSNARSCPGTGAGTAKTRSRQRPSRTRCTSWTCSPPRPSARHGAFGR